MNIKMILTVVAITFSVASTQQGWAKEQTVHMHVSGMTCGICPISVRHRVLQMQGVHSVHVDINKAQAVITYEDSQQSPQAMADAITTLGYPTQIKGDKQ